MTPQHIKSLPAHSQHCHSPQGLLPIQSALFSHTSIPNANASNSNASHTKHQCRFDNNFVFGNKSHFLPKMCGQFGTEVGVLETGWSKKLYCVNMMDSKVVFETPAYGGGHQTHHWLKMENQQHLSVHSAKNVISFFGVSDDGKQFTENVSLTLTLPQSDSVNFCEFDKKNENIYLVKNGNILEQRLVSGDHELVMSLKLEQSVSGTFGEKQLCLSDDGNWCAIAEGAYKKYWYLVDHINRKQFKLESQSLGASRSPCFIGGGSDRVVIGGQHQLEVWDINTHSSLQIVSGLGDYVSCVVSVGNIVAVGTDDNVLSLYDATTWNVIYSKKYEVRPTSLHLTADQKYLTVAGVGGEGCVVLRLTN